MKSLPTTTKVVNSYPVYGGGALLTSICDEVCH